MRLLIISCLLFAMSMAQTDTKESVVGLRGLVDRFRNRRRKSTTEPPKMCCKAFTAECLACSEGMKEYEFCELKPDTPGCPTNKPENPESFPEQKPEDAESNCCSLPWEDGTFCTMDAFEKESVSACGKCLFDQQCEGFQAAYDEMLAEDPSSRMATGLVYCCPDAKRCVDRRETEENPRGIGCPNNQETADCGYSACGGSMANESEYPFNCEGLCANTNFPNSWMAEMTCPSRESALGLRGLIDRFRKRRKPTTEAPKMCCKAFTAECLACSEGMKEYEFCELKPDTPGCPTYKPEYPETSPEQNSEGEDNNCCSLLWQDGQFCTMDDFEKESVPTCGKCLFDEQCEGYQAAYDEMRAEDPSSTMATGLVYCCPDAKRCLDRRETEENPRGVGCPSNQETADCGYSVCGGAMVNKPEYPFNCEGLCGNSNFPNSWMADMTCPNAKGAKESTVGIRGLIDRFRNRKRKSTTEPQQMCCKAFTAECLACSERMKEYEFCELKPDTPGCPTYKPEYPEDSQESEPEDEDTESNCCSLSWEDGEFCRMDAFEKESIPACGKCLFDQQCEGFQAAYDELLAEDPSSRMASGLVYCCPDAKRCVDRRETEENPRGIGCPSNQETADCGYSACGGSMANQIEYPFNCEGLCGNSNFPSSWMTDMTCPNTKEATTVSKAAFEIIGSNAAKLSHHLVGLFAIIGAATMIYFPTKIAYHYCSNNGFQEIPEQPEL